MQMNNNYGKCDVCGKETETAVCASACGAVSFAYCKECLKAGREPYDALVGMGILYEDLSAAFREQILLPSLKFFGKTVEQFNADINKMDEEFYKWCREHDNEDM